MSSNKKSVKRNGVEELALEGATDIIDISTESTLRKTLLKCIESVGIERVLRAMSTVYFDRAAARECRNEKMMFEEVGTKLRKLSEQIL